MAKNDDIADLFDDLGVIVDLDAETNPIVKAVTEWAESVTNCMKERIKQGGKVVTGELIQGIRARERRRTIDNFQLEVIGEAEHTSDVDEGRKPGSWPPTESIKNWLRQKDFGALNPGESKIDMVAYIIGKKIHDKGIEPFPFWGECLNLRLLDELIDKA